VKPGSKVILAKDFDPSYKGGVKKKEGVALLAEGVRLLSEYQARLAAQDLPRDPLAATSADTFGRRECPVLNVRLGSKLVRSCHRVSFGDAPGSLGSPAGRHP